MKKLLVFLRSQRPLTKIAAFSCILAILLGFYATIGRHPILMIIAGGISGFAAGFAVGAVRQSMKPKNDRRSTSDRRHSDHPHAQPVA